MKKQLSYYLKKLEDAGVDTSVFRIEANGIVLKPEELIEMKSVVGDAYLNTNVDSLQTNALLMIRMCLSTTRNHKKNIDEKGFNAYMRNALSYNYQFTFVKENLNDPLFRKFFTDDVLKAMLKDYLIRANALKDKSGLFELSLLLHDALLLNGKELRVQFKKFVSNMIGLPFETFKCGEWKDAYKGYMAFCVLKYLTEKKIVEVEFNVDELIIKYEGQLWKIYAELLESVDLEKINLSTI